MSEIDYKKIQELETQIDELIESRPSLKAYQTEITKRLMFLSDPADKLIVIAQMAKEKAIELDAELKKILDLVKDA